RGRPLRRHAPQHLPERAVAPRPLARVPRAPAALHRRRAGRHRGLPRVVRHGLARRPERRPRRARPAARRAAGAQHAGRPGALPLLGEPRGLPAHERELGPGARRREAQGLLEEGAPRGDVRPRTGRVHGVARRGGPVGARRRRRARGGGGRRGGGVTRHVDLRSDTVTRPTAAMRRAMAEAEVGDDVYGEDPTVNRLQAMVAEMAGHEAGLFVPSGTMGNQVAVAVHTDRGQEVVLPEGAHVYEYEPGAMAVVSGALPRFVRAPRGAPDPADVEAAIHGPGHQAPTGLVVLENTHNLAGGTVVPLETVAAVQRVARDHGLPVHLDGARAFNAAVALGVGVDAV